MDKDSKVVALYVKGVTSAATSAVTIVLLGLTAIIGHITTCSTAVARTSKYHWEMKHGHLEVLDKYGLWYIFNMCFHRFKVIYVSNSDDNAFV
jgi:hypothetical protein